MQSDSKRHEAQEWLQNNPNKCALAGNRFGTTENALKFVEQLYRAGAVKVYVTGFYEEEWRIAQGGGPYADTLIAELPTDSNSQNRRELFRISNEESEKEGFEPEIDRGQKELWFWWD